MVIVESQDLLEGIEPDEALLKKLDKRGVIVSSVGVDHDFVIRFFAPKFAIAEDPVTGSAYTQAGPYWSERLKKKKLFAKQLSTRTGELEVEVNDQRVFITGKAVKFLQAEIELFL